MTSWRTETETVSRMQKAGPFDCCCSRQSVAWPLSAYVMLCLSVRLSVTFVNSVERCNRIFNFFQHLEANHSGLSTPNVISIFRREPPNGGVECRWDRHKLRFWTNSWLSIDDCCSVWSTIDGRQRSGVSQLRCTSVYGTETATRQWIRRREENKIYLYKEVNLKPM